MTQDMHVYGFKKRATSKMNRSTHTLSILLEQLRSSLGAGKEQLRSSLEADKRKSGVRLVANEVTARRQRDYGSFATRLRLVIIMLLALMTLGATNAFGVTITYHIINLGQLDNDGNITTTRTEALQFTSTDAALGVPAQYRSPLAKNWKYYQASEVTYNSDTKVCTFNSEPTLSEGAAMAADAHIYVTYELDATALSNFIVNDGDVCNIKFNDNKYLYQSTWQNAPNTASAENANPTTTAEYRWKINIKDPYQVTIQSKSTSYSDFYLSSTPAGEFPNIRLQDGLSTAKSCKIWAFGLLPGGATDTYRLVVADGYTTNGTSLDSNKHGYLNNQRDGYKTTYHLYQGNKYLKCDLVFEPTQQTYTYHIVDTHDKIAISYTMPEATVPGQALNGYASIPVAIRSPYIADETITFYNHADCADQHLITKTPPTKNIYVKYTTTNLNNKFLHLRGARVLNVKINGELICDDKGALSHQAGDENTTKPFLWYFSGEDPYAIEISNDESGKKLGYATPSSSPTSLSYATSPEKTKFIIMATSNGDGYQQMELMAATGDGKNYRVGRTDDAFSISTTATGDASLQIKVNPVTIPATFKLIDKAGKILAEITSTSGAVELPDEWKSPLVSEYQYWKESAFTIEGDVYTLKANPAESDKAKNVTDNPIIYVTYKVNDKVNFETTDETTDDDNVGGTYRLQFINGESFHQENGKDAVMTTAQKGVYPYFCGDGMFYVYGDEQWNTQLNSGASTRSRWLWYVVSPTSDPYHVKIMSYHLNAKPIDKKHGYFRTFPVTYKDLSTQTNVTRYVTSLTTTVEDDGAPSPTEYMVLTGAGGHCKLVTVDGIDGAPTNGSYGTRQTVKTLEQYWKNNPTVQDNLGGAKVTQNETYSDNIILDTQQEAILPNYWHTYQILVNSAPWVGWTGDNTGKGRQYKNKNHWFQTINMSSTEGSDGEFEFVETTLIPQVILIDNHGWEIMRKPLYDKDGNLNTELKLYDSEMVKTYYWHPKSTKIDGYHKYSIAEGDEKITIYTKNEEGKWVTTGNTTTFTSNSLFDDPYVKIKNEYQEQDASVKTDFYITYDVKPEYANLYRGAATEGDVSVSAFWVKQGTEYAKNEGDALTTASVETDDDELKWYVKPNFNIDEEMGYQYNGEYGEKTKNETEAEYVAAGKNGFDPYNVQIQSVKSTYLYFKITTSANSQLSEGAWKGSSTALSLKQMSSGTQNNVEGYDQTKLSITNATFMVVKDASDYMLLMPRFDHTKVVNSFSGTQLVAPDAAEQTLELKMAPKVIHYSSEFAGMNGQYFLASDFTFDSEFESLGTAEDPFTGSIDGGLYAFSGLTKPLVAYADGAIIKNIILDDVNITTGTNVGAIVANATGETRIYNCGINGGSVGGSGDVGGIVGLLEGSARVINCYSYANVSGGTEVGGIVGYNSVKTTAAMMGEGSGTMIMNCMFYGDVTGGNVSPIYGGNMIENLHSGLNNYNYYAYEKAASFNDLDDNNSNKKYNCALAVEDKYLNRFEFYRLLLNSNRKLAAYYATSSEATVKPSDMMKWVLETADRTIDNPKPYPILKAQGYYPSIINYDAKHAPRNASVGRNKGVQLGTLSVTINNSSDAPTGAQITTNNLTLIRTDKDFDHFNFNYDKVQLPYYNDVGTGNYTHNKVVTGWKITAITAVEDDPYTSANYDYTKTYKDNSSYFEYPNYNFANRKSSKKDLYSVSGRVFSQGAYFDVPYGVTSITIEPYWGNAAYVADEYLDVVYNANYNSPQNVTQLGNSFTNQKITIDGSEQTVYTTIGKALEALKGVSNPTVYDYAVVLVGNLHQRGVPSAGDKPFTIMSVDLNQDNEPDYSMIYSHNNRLSVSPIRFDFLNIPGTAQAQKPRTATTIENFTIFLMKGWFETTNTCIVYSNQVEYENTEKIAGGSKASSPLILLGGDFEQFVSTRASAVSGKTIYIHVGGNVHIQSFGLGTHSDGSESTPHIPVSVTGGEYDGFYLTGTYNANAKVKTDNAECYISGGYFKEAAGASLEQIDGDVRWQIYNADIDAFFGGGINEAKPIKGNITTDIFNSHVTLFCGGPKFGNMTLDTKNPANNKTVTTTAEGCIFGKFFGAGYGGTSIARKKYYDKDGTPNWATLQGYYTTDRGNYFDGSKTASAQDNGGKDYGKKGLGVATDFEYEFFVWSSGKTGARLFVDFASFSLAQCNDVSSNLSNCTINQDFYGGGSLGKVTGKATSVLDGCTVHGNVFGGGYSAALPTIQVRDAGFTTNPKFNSNSGMFEPGVFSGTTEFTWKNAKEAGVTLSDGKSGSDLTNHYIYTDAELTALGQVKETDLTVRNNCLVEGGVFGGGDESAVNDNTLVKIDNVKTSGDVQNTIPNVYGGGNTADVDGNTEVRVISGAVSQDVYGGGRGKNTVVVGDVLVNIGEKTGELPTGTGTVTGNVYGGSAFGAVNASATKNEDGDVTAYTPTANKTTKVNIYAGTVDGSVFGGGLGYDDEDEAKDIVARNFGATTVNMEGGQVKTAVYGGANIYGVLKGDVDVNVLGGTVRTAPASPPASASDIKNAVFGGGYGQPTIVEGDIAVTIGTQAATPVNAKPTVYGNVYGGSALGKVQVNEADEDQLTKKIDVNLYGGTIQGNVFGGGLGRKAAAAVGVEGTPGYVAAVTAVEARVGGNVNVLLDGAKFDCKYTGEGDNRMPLTGQIFGANNLNGTPKGHVKVHVKRTVDSEKDPEVARDSRTTYDVAAVYGGGNQADYIPVDPTPETPLNDTEDYAEVLIEGCDLTSIEYVYGGGNAAAVPATEVTILGDYIIDYVFGGGNGKSTATFTNPGANVGQYNNGATDYGTGKAVTNLVGCHIHYVFGGSNTKGNVRGGTSVAMPEKDPTYTSYDCCNVRDIKEIYGAGNEAEQDGAVTMILGCVDNMDYVYGGARNAHVKGGVDLVVTSGHFRGVYGGNDTSGSIQGPIKVTIEETGCDPLIIDNLYLGGKDAAYSIYGYKNTGTEEAPVLVARTKAEYDALTEEEKTALGLPYADPVLNIVSCTRIGKESGDDLGGAFGGGYGAGATMYGNPTVNVNMIAGKYAKDIDRDGTPGADNDATALGIVRNVYGGGEQADVEGNTQVNIGTATTVKLRSDMGAPIAEEEQTSTNVLGALITDNVFGAGKGKSVDIESALVSGNTEVNICTADYSEVAGFKGISIAKSVYGGGQLSQVGGNTNITVSGGTIGTSDMGGATYGNIYGGGFGHNANVRFGLVKGNTNVTVTGGNVLHSVYGGGAYGSVGTYNYASEDANAAISALASENTTEENTTGVAKITITGGTIGTDGHDNGMVFGSSRGDIAAPDAIQDNMAWVYDTEVVIGTENDETSGPTIHGSLYGSGENGHTFHNASVKMYSGTIGNPEEFYAYRGNVYGGGCGTDKYYANPEDETHDGHGTLFNPKAGIVKENASVEILGGSVANNIYGAGSMGKVEGSTSVTINTEGSVGVDGNHDDGNVYGAARGELDLTGNIPSGDNPNDYSSVNTKSSVTITKGTVKGSVYGGGRAGIVTGQVVVNLNGGTVEHDAYGGGALAKTNTLYDGSHETYTTSVNLAGTAITGNLYGGGLGRLASAGSAAVLYADVNEYNAAKGTSLTAEQFAALPDAEKTKTPAVAAQTAVAANVNGPVKVSVTSGSATNVFGCNNLNGAPQTTVDVEIGAKTGEAPSITYTGSATVSGSVYGGGNMAAYTGSPAVKIYSGTVNTNVYGGGLGATAVTGGTSVTMEGGTVDNDVYGGGSQADVTGSVAVTIAGGTVTHDVYGGGALANTNTDNWTLGALTPTYINITDVLTIGTSPVVGLYTKSGDVYTEITDPDAKAATSTIYYEKRMLPGTWAEGKSSTSNTTSVILTGGVMGNVYGGGLGDDTTPVYVFGDVKVIINKPEDIEAKGGRGAAFTQITEDVTVGGTAYTGVPLTGRIFGCNNIKGTPLGDVLVEVYSTRQLNASGEIIAGHKNYEIQAVYGGGNQADYAPAVGKETKVNIYGCSESSIARVYGGGNSALVPSTDVTIWGSFDIEYAFAGGNGGQPVKTSSGWVANEGAGVNGHARITCHGGKIGEIFGGSDFKGIVRKATTTQAQQGTCPLRITKLYGAGKEADVDGDVNVVISGCTDENSQIEYVCGGSYKANISGSIHLTITAGYFQNVYGGNDQRGSIGGDIIVDIEETDPCKPIIINNLVGGGNQANFPGKKDDVELPEKNPRRTITVNVKSATYIGNVYGGSFKAETKANTFVNVNMIHGNHAGQSRVLPADFGMENAKIPENIKSVTTSYVAVSPTPSEGTSVVGYYTKSGDDYIPASISDGASTYYDKQVTGTIDNAIGIIGNVFGGGKQGQVIGNAQVNIGSLTEVPIMKRVDGVIVDTSDNSIYDGEGKQKPGVTIAYVNQSVLGAHITGDVFGGGEEAEVTGNAEVFICANRTGDTTFDTVTEGAEKVTIGGSVYGGGSEADVQMNTRVTMAGGYVYDGVYGGGLKGSVGTFTRTTNVTTESNNFDHSTHAADCLGKPTACTAGGTCTVVVSGGQVGPVEVATKGMKNVGGDGPVDVGFVFGAGRGEVENPNDVKDADFHTFVNKTDVTISGGLIMASVYGGGENGRVLNDTHVTISGGQIGCGEAPENVPRVYTEEEWANASVNTASTFKECLSWDYKSPFLPHDPYAQIDDTEDAKEGTDGHTYYGSVFGGGSGYYPYKKADGTHEWLRSAGAVYGNTVIDITGGHILTCVYGGNETTDVGVYTKNAKGHPVVHQSGGKCTINMVGGTIGVPRTDDDAKKHPVTCYLFGAGKGDQRTRFNTWTSVQETEVNVSGKARIFGSVFGGGEDGHILGDAQVNIGGTVKIDLNGDGDTTDEGETFTADSEKLKIGTTGTSYVDGNVFGGGRGFSGIALTAGSTGGNAEVNIAGGTMLGSIYGGGRLASVGIDFTPADDPLYGQLVDDDNTNTHGHIAINISGGTIGNDVANAKYGGNVFGGSMGRITLLDGTLNPIWPKQAVTKVTEITITGNTVIKRNVYGGSEYGIVRDKAIVNIGGTRDKSTDVVTPSGTPTIHGSVFGGGYGSDDTTPTYITAGDYAPGADYVFTPMIWTGCVSGDTEVNIAGGTVEKNVYGGGEVASVGLINCHVVEDENGDITIKDEHNVEKKYRYTKLTKHADIQGTGTDEKAYGFALSWPYKFEFISGDPRHPENIGGKATVNVTGGHIGSTTWDDRSGYVFGGSKGQVAFKKKDGNDLVNITDIHEQRYVEGLCANVRETEVNVKYSSTPTDKTPSNIGDEDDCIMGAVYGGGEDGHVYENAAVNITGGLIGLSVYGGGKGEGTYPGKLYELSTDADGNLVAGNTKVDVAKMPSWTAGKVYGNTTITMSNGHVMGNVYGGGNLGSVGKGNYAGGTDDYYPAGYGETLKSDPLWTKTEGFNPDAPITESNKPTTMADYFLSSGKCTISITGGTVGTLNGLYGNTYGTSKGTPTGIVFGGSRGRAARDVGALSPRYEYAPDFFLGYVNNTEVTIGTESSGDAPRIYSQVFGGARDGHVRGSAHVIVRNGIIGQTYAETAAVGTTDVDYQRYHRGNVYGAGSGLGTWNGTNHGTSSGSVTRNTTVDIYGGTIYNNVYGGGAMATVGPPAIPPTAAIAGEDWSKCTVNIYGGTIGSGKEYESVYMSDFDKYGYGGCVYGGSRGDRGGVSGDLADGETIESYATVLWTEVNINPHPSNRDKDAVIAGNVYGGAQGGQVKKDTKVNLTGGNIAHNAYGGGQGTVNIAADVLGNTTTELNNGVADEAKGCVVDKVYGCNDLNGTPKGHVLVHVYGTQNSGKDDLQTKVGPGIRTSLNQGENEGYVTYLNRLIALAKDGDVVKSGIDATVISSAQGTISGKSDTSEFTTEQETNIINAAKNVIAELQKLQGYDVTAVYGGGDLAPYVPIVSEETTEVIIEGCNVTSIKQVYGGGNAAYVPATNLLVKSAYVIDEVFGGGNGMDNYVKDTKWYENPGANVGYTELEEYVGGGSGTEESPYKSSVKTNPDATTKEGRIENYSIGTGVASTTVNGGYIHNLYGGSNLKGNIRREALLVVQQTGTCELIIDETTAGSKSAPIDAETNTVLDCVREGGEFYAGSTNADILNDVHVRITNGKYTKVFGGNKTAGTITGSITIDIEENGCTPIEIDELYAGGYLAPYSVYGYSTTTRPVVDENGNPVWVDPSADVKVQMQQRIPYKKGDVGALATPSRDPHINIISATKIGKIYGGCYMAELIGSPHINVNMTTGRIREKYASEYPTATYPYITVLDAEGNKTIPVGVIGSIFGGGNKGDVYGDTYVEIGTGTHHNEAGAEEVITPFRNAAFILREEAESGRVYGGGNLGDVKGNTNIIMGNGYVYDRIYGGGKEGNVGTVTTISKHTGDKTHADCIGKPTVFAENTGRTAVTVSGGYVGPFAYVRSASTGTATITPMTMQGTGADGVAGPDDFGYVFGAGRGELTTPATDRDIDFRTYVDSTVVTIKNGYVAGHDGDADYITRPLIAGGVYGGAENGRVLRNTHVNIQGGQIGLGAAKTAAYDETNFIDPTLPEDATADDIAAKAAAITAKAAIMPECASWEFESPWLPYDEHAGDDKYPTSTYGKASTTGKDGHTFYGNVFGGGSGYFTYAKGDGTYDWLMSAGLVEGNTYVNITGGHILTNVYGGNEMTNVTGTTHVTMTGGTLGVPRTLGQITNHPVTCYLFGAGKGDERVHFNKSTNVGHAKVNVSGGIIYGSVFGGGEDGHVLGNVNMNISDGAKIGTWGTSYVDGNVFGGGRGFSGDAYTAGNVAGSVTLNITGGTMLGSIYGGGRLGSVGYGLFGKNESGYGEMRGDNVTEEGFVPPGGLTKGRGHIEVNISGSNTVIGNKYEYQYISPETTGDDLIAAKAYMPSTQLETNNRLKHTRGGNVYAGGMGRYTKLDGSTPISTYNAAGVLTSDIEWKKLGNVKSTKLTISGNPWIMGNVYGGGEFGAVQGYHQRYDGETALVDAQSKPIVASTEILFTSGTVGTEITTSTPVKETIETTDTRSIVQYTFGSIYGGGMGLEIPDATNNHGGDVMDSTYISMSKPGESVSLVRASVYGGGEMAIVEGNTRVNISGGEIGRNEVKPLSDDDAGYVLFGGATMGNVYGGGKGKLEHTEAGLVKGNTNINISGGNVYHMVYGGGALGSVGTFQLSTGSAPAYIPFAGVPYNWTEGTGTATVNITGGTIGISGRDNGLVFGSSRGNLKKPEDVDPDPDKVYMTDPYDRVAWVNKSVVTIGTEGQGIDAPQPQIKCSVYGGGENGHNDESATVNVYSGTIGITDTEDPWYNFGDNTTVRAKAQLNRGNVYGAGSGSDTYTGDDNKEHWNPKSGMVAGNTFVNIYGGHIGRSVYGGGAMASVGTITNYETLESDDKHSSETNSFALSWPYKFVFDTVKENGKATVNVTGGHIGTRDIDGGDVYGSSRGEAGDRYEMAHLAFTKETEVNITYPTTIDMTSESAIQNDFTKQCITGSVHGSGENGYVYGDTHVTLNKGLIGHSLYGAGKGKGTYTKALNKLPGSGEGKYDAKIYSLIAGKVMGNTYVTMNGGRVGRNVYGGGNMGSVGKGNYAGGADDYYPTGYGETITGNLWTSAFDPEAAISESNKPDDAYYFLSSGKATVKVFGGIVGYIDADPTKSMKNELPYGNVFGGSAGEAAPNIAEDPRYEYSPAFFSGYVNQTDVTIGGGYRCTTAYTIGDKTYKVGDAVSSEEYNAFTSEQANWTAITPPTIYASVYGGGQDGHVRRDTKVTVLGGEIGVPYKATSDPRTTLLTNYGLDDPQWMHRGNIYGGGSGITKYKYDFNHNGKTSEDKNSDGIIEDNEIDTGTYHDAEVKDEDYSNSSGSVTRFTEVNVMGGTIHRNVYGGGSNGSVGAPKIDESQGDLSKKDLTNTATLGKQSQNTVNIGGGTNVVTIGTPFDTTKGWTYNKTYGGEVYGACRGMSDLDPEQFANSIWTKVNIFDKATIMGNVYGGGDNGIVKKDSEVRIGDVKQ